LIPLVWLRSQERWLGWKPEVSPLTLLARILKNKLPCKLHPFMRKPGIRFGSGDQISH